MTWTEFWAKLNAKLEREPEKIPHATWKPTGEPRPVDWSQAGSEQLLFLIICVAILTALAR